jgi:hypothetical protein
VTGLIVVLTDEGSSSTEEGVGTGGNDDTLGLSLLTGGTGETFVTELLALGKRLSSKSGLVHPEDQPKPDLNLNLRDINRLDQSTIGRTDITVLEGNQISGNEFGRFNLLPSTVTLDSGLGGQRLHQSLDGVTGVPLFDETNGRVDEQKQDNTDEILPIRGFTTSVGEGDRDDGGTFHDPRKRVPHEGKELEEDVFGFLLELVGTKDTDSALGLGLGETSLVALKELEDLLHDDVLDIDLVLVVQVGGSELDLEVSGCLPDVNKRHTVFMSTLAWRFSSFFSSMSLYSRFRLSGSAAGQ